MEKIEMHSSNACWFQIHDTLLTNDMVLKSKQYGVCEQQNLLHKELFPKQNSLN